MENSDKCTVNKPWGKFEQFCLNKKVTVKILTVKPQSKLSLQYHHHREEFWRVISGSGQVMLGAEIHEAKEGDEFFIKQGVQHRIMTTDSEMRVMEISYGEFDETDIVRLEDSYGREGTTEIH